MRPFIKYGLITLVVLLVLSPFARIAGSFLWPYLHAEDHRGGIAVASDPVSGEAITAPEFLDQGWDAGQSLWFYNTTQGSALLPYSFFLALEQPEAAKSEEVTCAPKGDPGGPVGAWFLCDDMVEGYRYLPQQPSQFNPDALPVGFVKETYKGKDYVGYTCAACHTGQVTYQGRALRIDGGPTLADMVGFLRDLTTAMDETLPQAAGANGRYDRFVARLQAIDDSYADEAQIRDTLQKWTRVRASYNAINDPRLPSGKPVAYGYGRLDAFGRIYNRVLQHAINRGQVADKLSLVTAPFASADKPFILTPAEIYKVLSHVASDDNIILDDEEFAVLLENLQSDEPGYPNLSNTNMLRVRNAVFNAANAPVSYPFLWDTTRSDFVQWNGLAGNALLGPLGRNTGEVIGVFAILDWHEETRGLNDLSNRLAAFLSGQSGKAKTVNFESSVDIFNLERLENHLSTLMSPRWPFCRSNSDGSFYLPEEPSDVAVDLRPCAQGDARIDRDMARRGELIYQDKCEACHEVIDRADWDRKVVGYQLGLKQGKGQTTDKAAAENGTRYTGGSGNFAGTYQSTEVGKVLVQEEAPVVVTLTAATKGVIASPSPDKNIIENVVETLYAWGSSITNNPMKTSIKRGNYEPDSTASPFASLNAYRARSLNGIWATAPYLHNGSVPSLYDLLLPTKAMAGVCEETRPDSFAVGSREFDPTKVGLSSDGYDAFTFKTDIRGNRNIGHEYGACRFSDQDRMDLIEYMKSL
jgi:cytochrome c5